MLLLKGIVPRNFLNLCACFSTAGKKGLSVEAERAVWATKVINSILSMKEPSDINNVSFRESLLKISLDNEYFEFSEEIKHSVIKIFDVREGADINSTVFSHDNVKSAIRSSKDDKFIFCPNYLTTKRMFE